MSELSLFSQQFPGAIPADLRVGDKVSLALTGVIRSIEDDLIDVTPMGGPSAFVSGGRTTKVRVTEIASLEFEYTGGSAASPGTEE